MASVSELSAQSVGNVLDASEVHLAREQTRLVSVDRTELSGRAPGVPNVETLSNTW